jgi:hypothetical protein
VKIYNFPTFPIEKQLFYSPGAAVEGGFTSGGARITSPEPGGRSFLDIQPAWQITEWDFPISSWLMSKINGAVFHVRLAPTPQVLSARSAPVRWQPDNLWSNDQPWQGDLSATYGASALEGTNQLVIDMAAIGPRLQSGHVIGHAYDAYLVDEINYSGTVALITVSPPLRRDVAAGDNVLFRPYFTGSIANGDSIRAPYDAGNVGLIQMGSITFSEVIA